MKTNKEYIFREIVGENVLVPSGQAAQKINGMIHLSETASFIWGLYDKKNNLDEIVSAVLDEFEIDEETARRDVFGFSEMLFREGIILEVPELESRND